MQSGLTTASNLKRQSLGGFHGGGMIALCYYRDERALTIRKQWNKRGR